MKWKRIKVMFYCEDKRTAEELIADAFMELGLQGVVLENSVKEPVDGFFDEDFIHNVPNAVIGYLPVTDELDLMMRSLQGELQQLAEREHIQLEYNISEIDEEDWAESWKAFFEPLKVGDSIVIKPTWREYPATPEEIIIEIDPGMAFGSGTHPTTQLCICMLEKYVKPGSSVIDIGTGSGILMITAAKLGAVDLLGIDRDLAAVAVARQNLDLNQIDPSIYRVDQGNLIDTVSRHFDIAAANILADTILDLLNGIKAVLKPNGGIFICSGIIEKNRSKVVEAMKIQGFNLLEIHTQDEWAVIVGQILD